MSCPDWRLLVAARERDPLADPPGWTEARAHLADCAGCRREALAADPLLLFQRLSTERTGEERDEVLAMQRGVAALVRASRVTGSTAAGSRRRAALRRVAAVAVLVLGVLALDGAPSPQGRPAAGRDAGVVASAELPDQPLIDELDLAQARVYELGSDDMAVVMVVDATLDV